MSNDDSYHIFLSSAPPHRPCDLPLYKSKIYISQWWYKVGEWGLWLWHLMSLWTIFQLYCGEVHSKYCSISKLLVREKTFFNDLLNFLLSDPLLDHPHGSSMPSVEIWISYLQFSTRFYSISNDNWLSTNLIEIWLSKKLFCCVWLEDIQSKKNTLRVKSQCDYILCVIWSIFQKCGTYFFICQFLTLLHWIKCSLYANPLAWSLGQVIIMKEFVWINNFFF
jgi:hypothetical protein